MGGAQPLRQGDEMLTWMLYVVVTTVVLSGAALAAERAARLRRAATRWIWAVTIVASLVIPTIIASVSVQLPNLSLPTVARTPIPLRNLTSVELIPLIWVREHTLNVVATHSENRILQRIWIAVSVTLLTVLAVNGLQLMRRKRRWRMSVIAGVPVYIAPNIGPAVVGLLNPRIAVPEWLGQAPAPFQATVIAHEQSHLTARDPHLLTTALFLLVLMPWNLPLWWQLHRLRRAIEVDCDARVLHGGLDTSRYGETLIEVSQRPSSYIGSVAAMSEAQSFLEERIAIMVGGRSKWGSPAAAALGFLALCLVVFAVQITPPNFGSYVSVHRVAALAPDVLDRYAGFYVRGSHIVVTIRRDVDHLLLQWPGYPPAELVADAEMNFLIRDFEGPYYTFVHDASRRTTALREHYRNLFSIPMRRIDAATAQAIITNNRIRARNQTPMPGSAVALRRLIEGVLGDRPNYSEMAPWYADLVRHAGYLTRSIYSKRGALRSIEFRHVDQNGGDVYEVVHELGFSRWTIWLESNGIISDAVDDPNLP